MPVGRAFWLFFDDLAQKQCKIAIKMDFSFTRAGWIAIIPDLEN